MRRGGEESKRRCSCTLLGDVDLRRTLFIVLYVKSQGELQTPVVRQGFKERRRKISGGASQESTELSRLGSSKALPQKNIDLIGETTPKHYVYLN